MKLAAKIFSGEKIVSPEQVFKTFGRDLSQNLENRRWLSNMMVDLRWYGLASAVYGSPGPKGGPLRVEKLTLTPVGEIAIAEPQTHSRGKITLEYIVELIEQIEAQNPSVKCHLEITWRSTTELSAAISRI